MIFSTTILPEAASEMAGHVDNLFWFIAITTGVTGLGVYAAILAFCVAYRKKEGVPVETPRILGSHKLELAWTIIPLLLFLVIFAWGAWVYNMALHPPADAPEIYVVGKQWMWKVQYPGGQRVILGANSNDYKDAIGGEGHFDGVMVLPVNKPVKIIGTSEDVIHDFSIPAFRQKHDVIPGRYTSIWYLPNKVGEYDIFCQQYCGKNHSLMVGKVRVVEQADYEAWLEGRLRTGSGTNAVDGSLAHQGRALFMKLNCIQCHNAQDSKAPLLEEIFGQRRPVRTSSGHHENVVVDEKYIRESIRKPREKVREGWEPIMPAFDSSKVNEEDIIKVIAYIKSLRKGETPVRVEQTPAPLGAPTDPVGPAKSGGSN